MVFSLRKKENVKVRQPLQKVLIPVLDSKTEEQILAVADLIKQEVNVKELQLINAEEASHLIVKQIKPNFKALGPKLGKDMKVVGAEIAILLQNRFPVLKKKENWMFRDTRSLLMMWKSQQKISRVDSNF
jgi:isoleucyl-tRNA synthetase